MRSSGRILAKALRVACEEWAVPGYSTYDIAEKMGELIRSYEGAVPAFVGYKGFPSAACISVNEQVVHGVPSKSLILKEGDVVSIDCGVSLFGHYTDACRTIPIGVVSERLRRLIKITRESLDKGISAVRAGSRVGDISYAVQRHVERKGFQVSLDYTGHGIGKVLHAPPCIPNYGPPGQGELLIEGQCLAIEPVVFDGPTNVLLSLDRWTVYSPSKIPSAHFEDTVIVSKEGPEVITR